MAGRFPHAILALMVVFGILEAERMSWHKVRMRAEDIAWIEQVTKSLAQEPIRLGFLEEAAVAYRG